MDMGVPAADQNQILSNCDPLFHGATMPERCAEDEPIAGLAWRRGADGIITRSKRAIDEARAEKGAKMSAAVQRYNVGGVFLPRPFKVRRLGHFGFNVEKLAEGRAFYNDLLGFKASDTLDFLRAPWFPKDADLGDPRGYFMRYGTDHHAFVLFPKRVMDHRADRKFEPEVTINQITWQCGSLKEIVDAHTYFEQQQVRIQRVGRDMPGSNWHVYVYDPDGHTNEFYYGIEQIGWNQLSKPREMYYRGFNEKPGLPQMAEAAELTEAEGKGIAVLSGHQPKETLPATFDVEGVLLPRPFKITKVGPVSLFVDDVDRAEAFYRERLGFVRSEDANYRGARCAFLRCGAEHHSLGLFPKELRRTLGLSEHTTCMSFGVEVGSYAQLRAAVAFLKEHGVTFVDSIPPELYPGIDYSAFALDPDGHCIQLYYYMEQIGWDGRVRSTTERRRVNGDWPEALEPLSDTYVDQVFQGPLG
jgi:catechol 2,3-dioxygenase-like lactoylglutathione lyase family enzyme